MTDFYSQCVAGNFQFFGKPFSIADLLLFLTLVILQHQISFCSRQFVKALVKIYRELLDFRGVRIRWRHNRERFRFAAPEVDLLGYCVKVQRGIAYIILCEPINLRDDDVDGLVSQLISFATPTGGKDSHQAKPYFLVLFARLVTVGVEPTQ